MALLDIAHLAFLEMIRDAIKTTGSPAAKGSLVRKAMSIADEVPEVEYASLDEWEKAVKAGEHPIAQVEGLSVRDGNLFSLPACPFAPSIKTYKSLFNSMPSEYPNLVTEYNKPSKVTEQLRVGYGAGVSPFCAIHQPLRSAIATKRIKVGGKAVKVYQLGCKAGDGTKGLADENIKACGVTREKVSQMLDNAMCVYAVKVE